MGITAFNKNRRRQEAERNAPPRRTPPRDTVEVLREARARDQKTINELRAKLLEGTPAQLEEARTRITELEGENAQLRMELAALIEQPDQAVPDTDQVATEVAEAADKAAAEPRRRRQSGRR